ncbi:LuxR C-terminal-related transcriptional regulator [Actinoallomurus purpureus]|uniref:LuxR C-terminal-related transcriptional regulator n=1 Tax=Actinoallomurus purpureus TaxID=478114 RepID=UPI002093FE3D|nr:LuxR family transcriptional regulator [Actinoallomurus purpureus]MCO6008603.1 LuxR C-terminal-related transcriptional regulator [Actinoallomurus purpureus]
MATRRPPDDAGSLPVWPFVGRTAQLDAVRAALGDGSGFGVVVAGPAGAGKTRLAAQVGSGVSGFVVAAVRGTTAAADIPFGAIAHLLPERFPPEGSANPLRWAAEALRPRAGDALLLRVDDAHLLDSASAALIHQMVLHRGARLLATVRSGEPAPDPIVALWKDGLVRRLELEPLPVEETDRLLGRVLGGRVERATLRRLWRVTQGNLLYLRELVIAGRTTGTLDEADGLWRWHGDLSLTPRLRDLVEARIGDVHDDERRALEFVALGEPLGADILIRLTDAVAVERCEARQLITTFRDGRRLQIRPAHPLYGEVVRARADPDRTREMLARLADAVEATGPRRREDALRVAVWRLDAGTAGQPLPLIRACRLAMSLFDVALAQRLGRAAIDAGGGTAAALPLAYALFFDDRPEEAEEILRRAAEAPATDRDRSVHARTRALGLTWSVGDDVDAHRIVDEAASSVAEPATRQELLVMSAFIHFFAGRPEDADRQLARARRLGGAMNPASAAEAAVVEGLRLTHSGRTVRARAVAETALREVARWRDEAPDAFWSLHCVRLLSHLFDGDLASAEQVTGLVQQHMREESPWRLGVAGFDGHRAQIRLLRGKAVDAIRSCRDGIAQLGSDGKGFAGLCFGELAHASALLGDVETARTALAAAERRSLRTFVPIDFPAVLARAWVLAAGGDLGAAVTSALAAAASAETHGLLGYRMFALHDVVRLGAASRVAKDLARLCATMDGPLAPVCARHAAAAVAGDGPELDAVSRAFERMGMLLHAAEAGAQAAAAYPPGDRAGVFAASRAWALAQGCQGARTPALRGLIPPRLTARQREIARLAAAGSSNREIAERLVLSPRTVANHLVGVYGRLGVGDRAALAELLGSLDASWFE